MPPDPSPVELARRRKMRQGTANLSCLRDIFSARLCVHLIRSGYYDIRARN